MEKLFLDEEEVELSELLGSGSYGKVWAGKVREKRVAVKVLHDASLEEIAADKLKLQELENEIKIMTENLHENIMLAMGLCSVKGYISIVMELLDGDLYGLLVQNKKQTFTLFQRLCMAKDAALGMNWLHERKPAIIHRDLKLENLMYKRSGDDYIIKIADFGLAVVKPKHKSTVKGEVLGTPVTMAPEVLMKKPYHEKADVYSFGLCLWQITSCQKLFEEYESADYEQFVKAICVKQIRPQIPKEIRHDHPDLARLIKSCWAADPAERPTFQEINNELDSILIHAAIADRRGRKFWARNFPHNRNQPWSKFYKRLRKYLHLEGDPVQESVFKAAIADCHKDKKTEVVNIESFGHFLQWYGPLDKEGQGEFQSPEDDVIYEIDGDKRTRLSLYHRLEALLKSSWFHGNIEEAVAKRSLQGKSADTFLIRCSRIPGGFAVTRTVANSKTPMSSRFIQNENGFAAEARKLEYHDTLHMLVDELLGCMDWTPCPGSVFQDLWAEEDDAANDSYRPLYTRE